MGLRQYHYELTLADKKERMPNTGLAKVEPRIQIKMDLNLNLTIIKKNE